MTESTPPLSPSPPSVPAVEAASGPYRVLARKYRPSTFEALIGQDVLVRTLTHAVDSGRLAQAWMLTGVRGVGKTTTARLIARALNCVGPDGQGGVTMTPCGVCDHCRAIAEDRHVDVQEMDAASHTGIDHMREILDSVRYRPAMARTKVYIIDEVHMLSNAAFNALLKTLEEPPAHVKFIFATTELRKVPVTVLSRCQRFDLRRVPRDLLEAHFTKIAAAENVSVDAEAINLIARAADGSVRDGLSLLDQAIAHGGGAVTGAMVADMLGLADRGRVLDLLDNLMAGRTPQALNELAAQYALGADPLTVLQDLLGMVHWMTRVKVAPESADGEAPVPDSDRPRALDMAGRLSMSVLNRAWQIMIKGLSEARDVPVALQAVEMTLIRLAFAGSLPTPEDALRRLSRGDVGSGAGPAASAASPQGGPGGPSPPPGRAFSGNGALAVSTRAVATPASAPLSAPGADTVAVPQTFAHLVELVRSKREGVLAAHLSRDVQLVNYDPKARVLDIHPLEGAPRSLAGQLGDLLGRWTGLRWMVTISEKPGQATLHDARQADIHADPLVTAVMAAFPGASVSAVRVNLDVMTPAADEAEAPSYEDDLSDPFSGEDDI